MHLCMQDMHITFFLFRFVSLSKLYFILGLIVTVAYAGVLFSRVFSICILVATKLSRNKYSFIGK